MQFKKRQKYAHLDSSHLFVPVAVETLGVEARALFKDIGRRIFSVTQEPLSHRFLVQTIAVAVQLGNAAAVLGTIAGASDIFS